MSLAPPDRQQGRVRRLGPGAMSAAARIGVGVGGVEAVNEDGLKSGALGFGSRQAANPHHAGDRGLERLTLRRRGRRRRRIEEIVEPHRP